MTKLIAKDIMVGDLVEVINSDHLKYVKVRNILDNSIITEEGEYESEEIKLENIKPIPLTTEIVQKNKIILNVFPNVGFFEEDTKRNLELFIDDNNDIWWSISCVEYLIHKFKYIHELQHAIKLVGIEKEIVL